MADKITRAILLLQLEELRDTKALLDAVDRRMKEVSRAIVLARDVPTETIEETARIVDRARDSLTPVWRLLAQATHALKGYVDSQEPS